jgi:hypothetical protein
MEQLRPEYNKEANERNAHWARDYSELVIPSC